MNKHLICTIFLLSFCFKANASVLFWSSQELVIPNGNPDLVDSSGAPIPVGSMWATMMFVDDEGDQTMNPDFFTVAPQFVTQFPGDDAPEPLSRVNATSTFLPGDFLDATFNDYQNQLATLIDEEVFTVLFNDPNPMNADEWVIVPDLFTGSTVSFIDNGPLDFNYTLGEITASDWNILSVAPEPGGGGSIPEPSTISLLGLATLMLTATSRSRRNRVIIPRTYLA